MEDVILLGQLQVNCNFKYKTILSCHLYMQYGEMARMEVSCVVNYNEAYNMLCRMKEQQLELIGQDEKGRQESLFSGLIDSAELRNVGDYTVLELKAVSYIWQMDIEKKSRSFQNISRTYKDITEEVTKEYSFKTRWNMPDRAITCPLIQYQETDYQFIRRIASHLGGRLLSEDYGNKKEVSIGLPQKSAWQIDIEQHKYVELLYKKPGRTSVRDRRCGYRIYGREFIRVGEKVMILGREYSVMTCEISFKHNSIETCVNVYPLECFQADKIQADRLKGVVIEGEVLQTKGEVLRLHLDIDDEQDVATAYDYPWRPIIGNMLYCMPEKGTKVALYFDKNNEENAKAIYNVRENGEYCEELADYNNRYFTSDSEKRLYMKPAEMGFLHMENQNAEIAISDSSMLRVKTVNKISILAEGQVQLQAKSVTVTAPKEATFVRKDITRPTVINMCNAFDAIGCTGNFAATPQMIAKKKRQSVFQAGGSPALPEQREEKYLLDGVIVNVLANIPAGDFGSTIMGAVAGSMPIITKVGK